MSMMSNAVCLGGNAKGYGFASMVSSVGDGLSRIHSPRKVSNDGLSIFCHLVEEPEKGPDTDKVQESGVSDIYPG